MVSFRVRVRIRLSVRVGVSVRIPFMQISFDVIHISSAFAKWSIFLLQTITTPTKNFTSLKIS